MNVAVFEDNLVMQLYPATIGRPAFDLYCGSYRLLDLVLRLEQPTSAVVRPHLREPLRLDFPQLHVGFAQDDEPVLLVNARLVPTVSVLNRLMELIERGQPAMFCTDQHVAAAVLGPEHRLAEADLPADDLATRLDRLQIPRVDVALPLFEYAHDLVRYHAAALKENLADRLAQGEYREIADGVFAASEASLAEYVVTNVSEGPIVLEKDAHVGPYCYLSGPIHIGARARVIEHAALKDGVALGHTTKVGGEIEASTVEPYTNKQHHGFIGHSYLGRWVNLGAGTSNSDLKNTYGHVSMEYEANRVHTGMRFIGCIIGDYAKTAVNTSIFTGKTIGTCAMVYGFVTTNVPSFVNYARLFAQVTEAPAEVMVATQQRMFARRDVEQRPCDIQLLHDMYKLTRHERRLAVEPLSL